MSDRETTMRLDCDSGLECSRCGKPPHDPCDATTWGPDGACECKPITETERIMGDYLEARRAVARLTDRLAVAESDEQHHRATVDRVIAWVRERHGEAGVDEAMGVTR